ncbi:MAG: lysine--tRNA ligase [Candidatus Omnitrophica bacterium]|nr:lysine--tRNA ligase [Candidatus Omnitrophota bacterium]
MIPESELVRERKTKRESYLKQGIRPYGERYLPIEPIQSILNGFQEGKRIRIAGRVMARRSHGKSTFCDLKDENARIQIYAKEDVLGPEGYERFSQLDLGDIVGIEGSLFTSKMGEKTVKIEKCVLLSKIIQVLPEKWHGLRDVEIRYRHRYVDLIVNDEVRKTFQLRSEIIREIRNFLDGRGFLEVETPIMQPIPGGARARPFVTRHEALDTDLYLRVAPELYLKRLLVGGFEKVYEVNRNFRNEGISIRHNPEFTMLELYQAYADYNDMMALTEELISGLAKKIHGKEEIEYGEKPLSFKRPWKRISFYKTLQEKTNVDWQKADIKKEAKKIGVEFKPNDEPIDVLNAVFESVVEPDLWNPTFVVDYPAEFTPLAKPKDDDPDLAYRFELYIGKIEIANAFSELNDPIVQREKLEKQVEIIGGNKKLDEDFVMALEYAMPPAGGLGIGIDRLIMILTNRPSIREVILFPQLRPETKDTNP